jgi:hypothetical protein
VILGEKGLVCGEGVGEVVMQRDLEQLVNLGPDSSLVRIG